MGTPAPTGQDRGVGTPAPAEAERGEAHSSLGRGRPSPQPSPEGEGARLKFINRHPSPRYGADLNLLRHLTAENRHIKQEKVGMRIKFVNQELMKKSNSASWFRKFPPLLSPRLCSRLCTRHSGFLLFLSPNPSRYAHTSTHTHEPGRRTARPPFNPHLSIQNQKSRIQNPESKISSRFTLR